MFQFCSLMGFSHRPLVATLIVVALSACSGATGPTKIEGVTARSESGHIRITNGTNRPIFTFVVGREISALINWAACADPERCPTLAPRASRSEPNPPPHGGRAETEALVYWWYGVRDETGAWRPDRIRGGIVPLR